MGIFNPNSHSFKSGTDFKTAPAVPGRSKCILSLKEITFKLRPQKLLQVKFQGT